MFPLKRVSAEVRSRDSPGNAYAGQAGSLESVPRVYRGLRSTFTLSQFTTQPSLHDAVAQQLSSFIASAISGLGRQRTAQHDRASFYTFS